MLSIAWRLHRPRRGEKVVVRKLTRQRIPIIRCSRCVCPPFACAKGMNVDLSPRAVISIKCIHPMVLRLDVVGIRSQALHAPLFPSGLANTTRGPSCDATSYLRLFPLSILLTNSAIEYCSK